MNRHIHVFAQKDLNQALTQFFIQTVKRSIQKKQIAHIALSGGTTPQDFYRSLSQYQNASFWKKIHLWLVDERFVAQGHAHSNAQQIKTILIQHVPIPIKNVHLLDTGGYSVERSAQDYEQQLIKEFYLRGNEIPVFDWVLLGIGEDGHTASLFPDSLALAEKQRLVVAVRSVPKIPYARISLTFRVLNAAHVVVFLVTGKRKRTIIQEFFLKNKIMPAHLVNPQNGEVHFYFDTVLGGHKGRLINVK